MSMPLYLKMLQRRVCGVDIEKVMEEHSAMALERSDAYLFAHFGTEALRAFDLSFMLRWIGNDMSLFLICLFILLY